MTQNQEKHQKYKNAYKPNELYWGLGVEHETYIESSKLKQITLRELKENRKQERYCVNYYSVYDTESLNTALDGLFEPDQQILIPILLNSHTFQKTDIHGEHKTTYERIPKPNTKFNGQTIHDWMKKENPDVFLNDYEKSYIFDGDTVEFMTQQFYKAKVRDVVDELIEVERDFMRALNSMPREGLFKTYGPFKIAQQNYPFASYLTNLRNNAMFNNGTIHINITLPTLLNDKAEIANMEQFIEQHRNFARVIQWVSPLILAKYGAYDPLCESKTNGERYSAGSQRVAVSRYIGLGTYDTDKMEPGKILTQDRNTLTNIDWYESFHKKVDYKFLNDLGMDINFNKHFCHGLEFRILESIPYEDIYDILVMIVYLADYSLNKTISNPKKSALWHRLAENCVHNGKGYSMDVSDQHELFGLFGLLDLSKEPMPVVDVLSLIMGFIMQTYKDGKCVRYMIRGEEPTNKPQLLSVPSAIITKSLPTIPEVSSSSSSSLSSFISSYDFVPDTNTAKSSAVMPVAAPIAPKPRRLCC